MTIENTVHRDRTKRRNRYNRVIGKEKRKDGKFEKKKEKKWRS